MKWSKTSYKQVTVKSIKVDVADIKRRMKEQHVIDLAADIEAAGGDPIHAPTIRLKDKKLICGRDRFAALLINKAKKLWVHLVECDDTEAAELEQRENIYRRHMEKGEWQAAVNELISLKKQALRGAHLANQVREVNSASQDPESPAFERKIEAEAKREVAREANIGERAVQKLSAHAKTEPAEADPPPISLPKGFQSFGVKLTDEEAGAIVSADSWLSAWDSRVREFARTLSSVESHRDNYAVARAHLQKLREALGAFAFAVREAMPASLCFYCKSLDGLKEDCPACGGCGVVGRHGGDNVPAELKSTEDVRAQVNGRSLPIREAEASAPRPGKPRKSIKVNDANGNRVDLDAVDGEADDDAVAFG